MVGASIFGATSPVTLCPEPINPLLTENWYAASRTTLRNLASSACTVRQIKALGHQEHMYHPSAHPISIITIFC